MDPASREQCRAIGPAGVGLGATEDHGVQPMPVLHHVVGAAEQRGIEQLNQHPEAEVIALMRRGRQQQQVTAVPFQDLGQFVVLGLLDLAAAAVGGQVVRFVEDHEIPGRGLLQAFDPGSHFQRVDAGDEPVMLGERVGLAVGDVALAAENLEIEVEDLVQFSVPVVDQPGRHDHQGAIQFAPAGQFPQNQCRLDRLAQADFISDQEAAGRGGGDTMRQHHLMREQINLRRGQGRSTVQERQSIRLIRQPRPPIATFSGSHIVDDVFRASDRERERGDGYLPFAGAEEDAHEGG